MITTPSERSNRKSPTLLWSAMAFVRFGAAGFSLILPLLGAGTVTSSVPATTLAAICLVATCFHVFAFVSNDVADLRVDRTEPRRADFPLVRGVVSPTQALALALAQVPASFALAIWAGTSWRGLIALAGAYVSMTIYNLFGKRTALPWLTDAVQGLAWALLCIFGMAAVGGAPTPLTWVVGAYVFLYVQMINGVHGGVRDLANDLCHGLCTTAIMMGAHLDQEGRAVVGSRLFTYALVLQSLLVLLALVALPMVDGPTRGVIVFVVLGCAGLLWRLLHAGGRALADFLDTKAVGLLHALLALMPLLAITLPRLSPQMSGAIIGLLMLPVLTLHPAYPSASWMVRVLRRSLRT